MTVRVYLSTDAGAPVLNGQAGSAIALLKACLVTGYGAKAAAGWAEAFTGTNLSVLRAPIGNRHYFRFDDTNGRHVQVAGYLTMSDVSNGTGQFPAGSGSWLGKSDTADSSSRQWIVVADEKTVHFMSQWTVAPSWSYGQWMSFGEYLKFSNAYPACNSYILGSGSANPSYEAFALGDSGGSMTSGLYTSMSLDGSQNGISNRRKVGINRGRCEGSYSSTMSNHPSSTPSVSTGGLLTSPLAIFSTSPNANGEKYSLLGMMRGVREFLHDKPLSNMDTINGQGDLAGKTFIALNGGQVSYSQGQVLFETSDTWE